MMDFYSKLIKKTTHSPVVGHLAKHVSGICKRGWVLILFLHSVSWAQDIVQAEYFMGEDPGFGNAIQVDWNEGQGIDNASFAMDISAMQTGFHKVFIRAMDESGTWSIPHGQSFYIENQLAIPSHIVKAEYYLNDDPGVGQAINIPVSQEQHLQNVGFAADIGHLDNGFHKLFIRVKNENGLWSHTHQRTFYKEQIDLEPTEIVKAEYYLNSDPGFGNGIDIPVSAATVIESIQFTADISSLAHGFHNLYLRVKDEDGRWSTTHVRSFYKQTPLHDTDADIVEAEYFFNTDPGIGNATPVDLTQGPNISITAMADLDELETEGLNYLYIRAKDSNGVWSITHVTEFTVDKQIVLQAQPEEGGSVSGGGWYEVDYELTVHAEPHTGYEFSAWKEDNQIVYNQPEYTFTVTDHRELEAHFAMIEYELTLEVDPQEAASVEGDGFYVMDEEVELQVYPADGWTFLYWTDTHGEEVELENGLFIMPAEDVHLTAHFEEIQEYNLTLEVKPDNAGLVEGEGSYPEAEVVQLTASAFADYEFVSWVDEQDETLSTDSVFNFTMPAHDVNLNAVFQEPEPPGYTLNLIAEPEEGGVLLGAGTFQSQEQVSLAAVASDGYEFVEWTDWNDEQVSDQNTFVFTMPDHDATLTAHFELTTLLQEAGIDGLRVYPNPVADVLHIVSEAALQKVELFDMQGIKVGVWHFPGQKEGRLGLESLSAGTYLLRVTDIHEVITQTIQVVR